MQTNTLDPVAYEVSLSAGLRWERILFQSLFGTVSLYFRKYNQKLIIFIGWSNWGNGRLCRKENCQVYQQINKRFISFYTF